MGEGKNIRVGIFMANGLEEVECLTAVDLLRRAGIEVTMISIHKEQMITGAHQIGIMTDVTLDDFLATGANDGDRSNSEGFNCFDNFADFDGVILPGGMPGTLHLQEDERVCDVVRRFAAEGRLIAAICAAPTVFGAVGLLQGKNATCYPSMEDGLIGANWKADPVVVDGNIITSRGVGTAIDFSLEIIAYLMDRGTAEDIGKQIVYVEE